MERQITKNQLQKSKDFFLKIYNSRGPQSQEKIKCILESAPVYKLRSLVRLFSCVLHKIIPCKNQFHRKKIKEFAHSLRPFLEQFSNYLKEKKPKLLQFFCAILPIVRFFVIPLFEFDIPDTPEGGLEEGIEDIPFEEQEEGGEEIEGISGHNSKRGEQNSTYEEVEEEEEEEVEEEYQDPVHQAPNLRQRQPQCPYREEVTQRSAHSIRQDLNAE